jgi:hypothetical protein
MVSQFFAFHKCNLYRYDPIRAMMAAADAEVAADPRDPRAFAMSVAQQAAAARWGCTS